MIAARATALVIAASSVLACGPKSPFRLTGGDNDADALAVALRGRDVPLGDRINASGGPIAVVASAGEVALVDLALGKARWRSPAKVTSRIAISASVAVAAEGKELVARDLATGQVRWRSGGRGELLGVTADRHAVYATWKSGKRWILEALDAAGGGRRWEAESSGRIGAPSAGRGLVFVPYLSQWLTLLDAKSGALVTRVRGVDEEISFSIAGPRDVYFGSKRGVFLLDERAASGRRGQGTYGAVTLPEVFADLGFAADAYDRHQSGYSARERRRIIWRGEAAGPQLAFDHGNVVLHWYRYLFAVDPASGDLRWAYSHPRVDLVGVAHLGDAVGAVAVDGSVFALDPKSGAPLGAPIASGLSGAIGATFDADGWAPQPAGEPPSVAATLGAIANDRDARFAVIKRYAVGALAKVDEPRATAELLELANGGGELAELAAEALVARADPAAVPMLVTRLAAQYDHVAGTRPACVQTCSMALAGMPAEVISDTVRGPMIRDLLAHFESPATAMPALEAVAAALAKHGAAASQRSFRRFLTIYRADPSIAEAPLLVRTVADAVARSGAPGLAVLETIIAAPTTEGAISAELSRAIEAVKTPPPEPAKPEGAEPEPRRPEPAKPEPAKPEPAKPEPAKPKRSAPPKPAPDKTAPARPAPAKPVKPNPPEPAAGPKASKAG